MRRGTCLDGAVSIAGRGAIVRFGASLQVEREIMAPAYRRLHS